MFKDRLGNYKLKIAFDFDDTLTEPTLFALAQRLIGKGHDVWILTARGSYEQYIVYCKRFKIKPIWPEAEFNSDLLKAAKELGIAHKIIYTNNEEKKAFFQQHAFDLLFDDDPEWHCNAICEAGGIAVNV
jgi:hypothetical protein